MIMIVVDMITLEEIVAELGFEGRFDPEEASHPLSIKFGNDGGGMWISEDMLGRIGMECGTTVDHQKWYRDLSASDVGNFEVPEWRPCLQWPPDDG
ncbi:hypothetical protein [Rhizobium leguminosarum]|uniref:hypothetical protein n=1 Tax=Rhizobium leguminosarum TaxID=384 RepID=UPI001C92A2F9|nr:hypothetical protein [Rhizobium leguminosarum]MBY3003899.1 hypothetical protein [Rhizobium leguminosarum]